jgi:hypothetical protein
MNVEIKRKYIYLSPTPKHDIPDGLMVELFEPMNDYSSPIASTWIYKGRTQYEKPNKGTADKPDYNTVKSAWIKP